MKSFVQSRSLSKKFKKKLFNKTKNIVKKKVLQLVANKAIEAVNRRTKSLDVNKQKSFQQSSSTTTRINTNTLSNVAGNIFLSIPKGYIMNTMLMSTTRLLTEQEAVNLGLISFSSMNRDTKYSSYQNSEEFNSAGSAVSRSINNQNDVTRIKNYENTNGYYVNTNLRNNMNGSNNLKNIISNTGQGYDKFSSVRDYTDNNNNYEIVESYKNIRNKGTANTMNQINGSQLSGQYKLLNNNVANNDYRNYRNIDIDNGKYYTNTADKSYKSKTIDNSQRVDQLGETENVVGYDVNNNIYNRNTGVAVDYKNIKTSQQLKQYTSRDDNDEVNVDNYTDEHGIDKSYQNSVVNKNSDYNAITKKYDDNEIDQVGQKTESKHIKITRTETGTIVNSKTSDNDNSDNSSSSDDANDDEDKSKSISFDKHRSSNVYGRSINVSSKSVQNVKTNSVDYDKLRVNTGQDDTGSTRNVINDVNRNIGSSKTEMEKNKKHVVNLTQNRNININSNSQTVNVYKSNDESDENSDEDDDSEEISDDDVSVYEHLNTYRKFRFDNGLNSVGLIGEMLNQLDNQRYKLMDDIIYPQDATRWIDDKEVFDFIIVGGGNAGCVLANKLSENPKWKILLIEAGGDALPVTQIPGLWDRALNSVTDWQYKIEPNSVTGFGISGNMKLHKGKCLGGSSTTSSPLYLRGSEKLYNSLVTKGLQNWSYNKTETYFKRIEKIRSVTKTETNTIYGKCGLMPVSRFRKTETNVLEKIVSSGFEQIGCQREQDINNKDIEVGFVSMQGVTKNGRTYNTAKAYLSSIIERENLIVMKHTKVSKIIIDEVNIKATGVEVRTKFGQNLILQTRNEVLLCAGSVGSAQILMASGIGPKNHLSAMDIPVIKDLQVGNQFLITPVFTGFVMSYDKEIVSNQTDDEIAFKYLARHSGPLSLPKGMCFGAFLNTGMSGLEFADVEVHQFYVPKNSPSKLCQLKSMFGFSDNVLTAYSKLNAERAISIYTIALINVKSTSKILLRSKNTSDSPIIVGNLLTNEMDTKSLLEAIKQLSEIKKSKGMMLVDATLEGIDLDGCAKYTKKSDDYWNCLLKYMISTTSSTAGSCRMGLQTDPEAVVDGELNVIGISNLRVVGRSVMPMITSAYSHVPCIMIAEKASDMIRSKYNYKI